jgi:hypothetical protein
MRRTKTVRLVIAAVCALTALTAMALASTATAALPELLPEPTGAEPILASGKGGAGELTLLKASVEPIACKESVFKGDATSLKLGTGEIKIRGCTSKSGGITVNCTELASGAEVGLITIKNADLHFWYALLSAVKQPAVVGLLLENVHFICGGLVLIEVLKNSCIAGLILAESLNKLVKEVKAQFLQSAAGDPDMPEVLNEENKEIPCELKVDVAGEATMGAINEKGELTLSEFEKDLSPTLKDKVTVLLDA